jgi:hypothetical protein
VATGLMIFAASNVLSHRLLARWHALEQPRNST